jgi:WD40 repeat protein
MDGNTAPSDTLPVLKAFAVHPGGSHLATGGWHSTVAVWEASTGRVNRFVGGDITLVGQLAFHPAGQNLAVGGYARGGGSGLEVWDTRTAERRKGFAEPGRTVSRVAFSP